MELKHTPAFEAEPGTVARLLTESYAELLESEPDPWLEEQQGWLQFDRDVFNHPETIGACTFLSWHGKETVGLFSYDLRPRPAYGVIGHNCILPECQGQGFGKGQVREILRRFRQIGLKQARVSTGSHRFFVPAQRMYASCGFAEVRQEPWDRDPRLMSTIHYEKAIG